MRAAIHDHALIGDGRSAALVSRGGSIDWLCWPRFDSPSIFAAILDDQRGGCFTIAPCGWFRSERRYLPDTNVLETRFIAAGGELTLTDFMPVVEHRGMLPEHELVRLLRCDRGEVEVEIVFDPRPDYGRKPACIKALGKLGLRVELRESLLALLTDAPLPPSGRARVRIRGGQTLHFSLGLTVHGP